MSSNDARSRLIAQEVAIAAEWYDDELKVSLENGTIAESDLPDRKKYARELTKKYRQIFAPGNRGIKKPDIDPAIESVMAGKGFQ